MFQTRKINLYPDELKTIPMSIVAVGSTDMVFDNVYGDFKFMADIKYKIGHDPVVSVNAKITSLESADISIKARLEEVETILDLLRGLDPAVRIAARLAE